jgi:hypothetical protein
MLFVLAGMDQPFAIPEERIDGGQCSLWFEDLGEWLRLHDWQPEGDR